jgi:hypothetical protein
VSKAYRQSHISSAKYGNGANQKTPNYSMAGNPMSNYTGGYQYSHMHQSLDQEELMEPIYDNDLLVENNIRIEDGIQQMDEIHYQNPHHMSSSNN